MPSVVTSECCNSSAHQQAESQAPGLVELDVGTRSRAHIRKCVYSRTYHHRLACAGCDSASLDSYKGNKGDELKFEVICDGRVMIISLYINIKTFY